METIWEKLTSAFSLLFWEFQPLVYVFWSKAVSGFHPMLGFEYLFAESWLGPSITMVINTISPENKGFAVSAYLFFATVAGTIATELLSVLQTAFKAKENPEYYGYILFAFVCFSYGGSIPFMYLAGKHYKAFKEKEDAEKALNQM